MREFFNFKRGDVIAEIGAGSGTNLSGFNLLTDSSIIYLQDIDKTVLNQKSFERITKRCNKQKATHTNRFTWKVGTEKSSELPDNTFDKIILIAVYHEFTFIDDMIADINRKLKPGGKLYILEAHCSGDGHKNYTAEQVIERVKSHKFSFVKKDGKDINNSTGLYRLVFEKSS